MLAKRPVQSAKTHRLNNRLREQAKRRPARSHKNALDPAYLYQAKNRPCALSGSSCCASEAARIGCTVRRPVGASLLAKRPVQSAKIHRLNNRLREQAKRRPARSHKSALAPAYLYQAKKRPCALSGSSCCASEAARIGCTVRRPVGASLLAKRPVQSMKIHRLNNRLREQAKRRPVRSYARRAEALKLASGLRKH